MLREHLCALTERSEVLAGIEQQAFIDIDSLLRPVYGHAKQGASYGHTKIAGKQVLRKGFATGHHDQHRALRAGDRRDAATRWAGRIRQGALVCRARGASSD